MKFPWPWKRVEEIEREGEREVAKREEPRTLDDDVEEEEVTGEMEVSGEVEKVVRQTQDTMNDGLDKLQQALDELRAEVHGFVEGQENGE